MAENSVLFAFRSSVDSEQGCSRFSRSEQATKSVNSEMSLKDLGLGSQCISFAKSSALDRMFPIRDLVLEILSRNKLSVNSVVKCGSSPNLPYESQFSCCNVAMLLVLTAGRRSLSG